MRGMLAATQVPAHECGALGGVMLPLVAVSAPDEVPDARHVVVAREDYARSPSVSGVSAVRLERGDGSNDVTVLASPATLNIS